MWKSCVSAQDSSDAKTDLKAIVTDTGSVDDNHLTNLHGSYKLGVKKTVFLKITVHLFPMK